MDNMYIIPANTKSGNLIFNIFRPVDLVIFLVGLAVTMIFFFAIPLDNIIGVIIKLLPIGVGTLLVVPIPHYHNVLCFIKDALDFYSNRRVYIWKGWCVKSEYTDK